MNSFELLVLIFCFEYVEYRCLFTRLMVPPVCPWKSSCTPYDASIHHLIIMVPSYFSGIGNQLVAYRYLMVCCNFFQSSISGSRTHVHRKDTFVWIYGLALLDRYSSLAARWLTIFRSSLFSFYLYLYISNRWLAACVSACS